MLPDEGSESLGQRGRPVVGERVARVPHGVVDVDETSEIHRRAGHDDVAIDGVDRRLELLELLVSVSHRREHVPDGGVLGEGVGDRADRVAAFCG